MAIQVTPIPKLTVLTDPNFTLGTANAAGSALTSVASDSTLLAFDTTVPAAVGTGATGSAVVTTRRDHVHGGLTYPLGSAFNLGSNLLVGNGGSTGIAISADGEVNKAAQPAFLTKLGADANDVTGDGTAYTILWGTETFDQGSNLSGSTFTAPVAGRYHLSTMVTVQAAASGHTSGLLSIVADGVTFQLAFNPYNNRNTASNVGGQTLSVLCNMSASSTAIVTIAVAGGGKVVDVNAGIYSFFSGYLVA